MVYLTVLHLQTLGSGQLTAHSLAFLANADQPFLWLLQADLGKLGYAFQFITLAGFHTLNHSMFQLAKGYAKSGMTAYSALQQEEFAAEKDGYTATKHQREVRSPKSEILCIHAAVDTTKKEGSLEHQ